MMSAFRQSKGKSNTHPTKYVTLPGSKDLKLVQAAPAFTVRVEVDIPLAYSGKELAVESSDQSSISNDAIKLKLDTGVTDVARLTFAPRSGPASAGKATRVTIGVAKPMPLAGDLDKTLKWVNGVREIDIPFASVDVVVEPRDNKVMIARVGARSIAAESSAKGLAVDEYKLGTVLKFDGSALRGAMIADIKAAAHKAKKPVVVAPGQPNNVLALDAAHLVFGCHGGALDVLKIGEFFRNAAGIGVTDKVFGDSIEFVPLRDLFKVIWLAGCNTGALKHNKEFVQGVATKANCYVVGAFDALAERPRVDRSSGKLVTGLPLLKDQVDVFHNPFIAPPGSGVGTGAAAPVFEGDFLLLRRRLGFSIAEYDGLPVDDDVP